MQFWNLYVDESGAFSDLKSPVVVGGPLIPFLPHKTGKNPDRKLGANIRKALPEVPWPPHARLLNCKAMWLLWAPERLAAPEREVYEQLLQAAPEACDAVFEALDQGREPHHSWINALNEATKGLPPQTFKLIHAHSVQRRSALYSAFVGFEGHALLASEWPSAKDATGRYLAALQALLTRVQDGLNHLPGRHGVNLYVATRHLEGTDREALAPEHIQPMLDELGSQLGSNTVWCAVKTWVYHHQHTPAGLIFADHLVNMAYNRLKQRKLKLSGLEGVANAHDLNHEVGAHHLPWPTAHGVAEQVISGELDLEALNDAAPWVKEQADRWLTR